MSGYIEKRGENSYRLVVPGECGPGGKRKKITRTVKVEGKTEAEKYKNAEDELAKLKAEIKNNSFIENPKLTFKQLSEKWMKEYAEINLAPKTVYRYKELLDTRINPALGHLKISKIKPMHLLEFYNNLTEDGIRKDGKKGGLSPLTIKHHHRLIHAIFESAVQWQFLSANPASHVNPPKVKKAEAGFLEIDEIEQLVARLNLLEAANLKYKTGAFITLCGGVRLGELMGLIWPNIDFKKKAIQIKQANQYLPRQGIFTKDTKNYTSSRTIILPDEVFDIILEYKNYQEEQKLKCGSLWHDSDFVFTQKYGEPMHPYTMTKWFSKFIEDNNLKKITFHQLRHTSASVLVQEGINIKEVSSRLGHSTSSTTLNIYSHVLKSADQGASDAMRNVIFKKKNNEKET